MENWHNFSTETIAVFVATISATVKISVGMVSLMEYDGKLILKRNERYEIYAYTYRYY
jgi:hypothetical protein